MTDNDRLAALLCDLFPTAERSRWPFSVQLAAERLIAAGVTVAPSWGDDEQSKPICVHGRPYGLHDEGEEDCATFRTVREFGGSLANVRVLGHPIEDVIRWKAEYDMRHGPDAQRATLGDDE